MSGLQHKLYPNMSASDLSAMMLKGTSMSSLLERDAGFCSGSSEHDDEMSRDGTHSPTDASEDSVEVKVTPIGMATKNKRKSKEPLRVVAESDLVPLKKRVRFETSEEEEEHERKNCFRPWAPAEFGPQITHYPPHVPMPSPADLLARHPGVTTLHRAIKVKPNHVLQEQPLALVAKKLPSKVPDTTVEASSAQQHASIQQRLQQLLPIVASQQRAPPTDSPFQMPKHQSQFGQSHSPSSSQKGGGSVGSAQSSRNYKNMTRERRIEANARERTRVHTISAAFDTLRQSVPSYSNTQKLSKLSVLRIACSYILTLSRMAGEDYSEDQSEPSLGECVDSVTKTIQVEGKIRKKKDE